MSKYSGKCDFYDHIEIFGLDNVLASNIYIGDNPVPLRIDSQKDCIPYYAHLVSMSATTNGVGHIVLSERSYIDVAEETHLSWVLRNAIRYYKKCKRNKIPFTEKECLEKICLFEPRDYEKEIVFRVGMLGTKATIEGIHIPSHNEEREMIYDEMINNGYPCLIARYWLWKDYGLSNVDPAEYTIEFEGETK